MVPSTYASRSSAVKLGRLTRKNLPPSGAYEREAPFSPAADAQVARPLPTHAQGCVMFTYRWMVLLVLFGARRAERPEGAVPWRDTSPHMPRMVTVAPGASLEVLDWGGRGRPLVLLAGLGNSAHVFDEIAASLTDSFHVQGITRRGFGYSSGLPDSDATSLINDLRIALDTIGLTRVILVGHSIAGEELTGFAALYPDRCDALVYLDAAADRSNSDSKLGQELDRLRRPATCRPAMTTADSASVTTVATYYARTSVRFPDAEVRAFARFDSTGRYAGNVGFDSLGGPNIGRLLSNLPPPQYRRLKCPSLAIYAVPDSAAAYFPWWETLDAAGKRDALRYFRVLDAGLRADRTQYRQNAPSSHVVEIHNASHWVFLSHRDETLSALRMFLTSTPRPLTFDSEEIGRGPGSAEQLKDRVRPLRA
jgi:non-heme chloroperoxidase